MKNIEDIIKENYQENVKLFPSWAIVQERPDPHVPHVFAVAIEWDKDGPEFLNVLVINQETEEIIEDFGMEATQRLAAIGILKYF